MRRSPGKLFSHFCFCMLCVVGEAGAAPSSHVPEPRQHARVHVCVCTVPRYEDSEVIRKIELLDGEKNRHEFTLAAWQMQLRQLAASASKCTSSPSQHAPAQS